MEVRALEFFWTVAQEGSFTRAAERLRIAQSAVSQTVRTLENELGVALFDRSRRRIRLTPAGELLVPRAREAMDVLDGIRDTVRAEGRGVVGSVTLGLMTSVTLIDVPGLLTRFHREHPDVTVRLRAARNGSAGLVEQLVDGDIDLALLALTTSPPAAIAAIAVAASPMVLVVPAEHPLAAAASVRLADLVGEDFVDLPEGYGGRTLIDQAFAAAGVERRALIEVADIGTAAEYVSKGLGVALLPEFAARRAHVALVPVAEPLPEFTVSLATAKQRRQSAAVRALADEVRAMQSLPAQ